MKRYGNLWPLICDRNNIELAADKALKGKQITKDRRRFIDNRQKLLDDIEQSLKDESYQFGDLYSFTVFEPKERTIHCPRFYPDRILHHALMNIVVPLFIGKFTADTYGSIKGRGIKMAVEKLSKALSQNPDWYYLQVDMRHFYESIDHDIAKQQIRRVIKCRKTLEMFDSIIDVHPVGMPIGSYTSQYIGNLVLSPVDHWAKEEARVKHYYRYMDDIVFLVPDKASVHRLLNELKLVVDSLRLTLKNNIRIAPVTAGIDFIGYRFFPTHTRLRKRIKLRMQRNVRRLIKRNVSDEFFKRKTASHFGWCMHANCRNLLRKTLSTKLHLFEKNMEIKRLSDIRKQNNWFLLSKDQRVSIEALVNVEIVFWEFLEAKIKGESKTVVKFSYPNKTTEFHYFITRSEVIRDRLEKDRELLPFVASVKRVKNWLGYE